MDFDTIMVVIFVLIFLGGSLVKRLLAGLSQQAAAEPGQKRVYEATPQEVREFLESLARPRAAQPPIRAEVPQEGPQGLLTVVREQARPAVPPARQAVRREPQPALRKRAPRPPRRAPERARVEPEPQPKPAAVPARGPGIPPREAPAALLLALRGSELKKAVIWSEILAPPVALRAGQRRRRV
jgi:hypothetical protein